MRYFVIVIALLVSSTAYADCSDTVERKSAYRQQHFSTNTQCSKQTPAHEQDVLEASSETDEEFSFSGQKRQLQANSAAKLFLLLLYSVGSTTDS